MLIEDLVQFTEFKELEKFKKELEQDSDRECIEDYELERESNEYHLKLYSEKDIRHLITAGRCAYVGEVLEVIGQYESIHLVLNNLEKKKVVRPYVLGGIHSDLWNLRDKCLYIQRDKKELIIYSDYSIDTFIKFKGWANTKENPANRLIKYTIKTENSSTLLKELENEFFIQEI